MIVERKVWFCTLAYCFALEGKKKKVARLSGEEFPSVAFFSPAELSWPHGSRRYFRLPDHRLVPDSPSLFFSFSLSRSVLLLCFFFGTQGKTSLKVGVRARAGSALMRDKQVLAAYNKGVSI